MRLFLLLLTGCAYQGIEDRWADTFNICDPPQPYFDDPYVYDTSWITEDCQARIVEDFGVDTSTFNQDQLDCFLLGAVNLMARDMGDFQDLEPGPYVRRPFIHALAQVRRALPEGDEVARLAYDFATYHIGTTQVDERVKARGAQATYWADGQLMLLSPDNTAACSAAYAATIVHEASHAFTPSHVPCPWDASIHCDKHWSGGYGFEAATNELMQRSADAQVDEGYGAALMARDLAASRIIDE